MGIKTLIEQLSARGLSNGSSLGHHSGLFGEAATALSTLQAENEKLRETVDKYATAARAIALHLKPFCDESFPYDEMIADAARKASDELEQVKEKYDAAIEYLREIEWCAGCKHFGGLDGCKKWAMGQCTEKHDLYEFIGPQKED